MKNIWVLPHFNYILSLLIFFSSTIKYEEIIFLNFFFFNVFPESNINLIFDKDIQSS